MGYSEYRECEYAWVVMRQKKNMGPVEARHYHWHGRRKIDDKVKNKIYFKRTQLLRGFPGRKNVCLGKCARVDS